MAICFKSFIWQMKPPSSASNLWNLSWEIGGINSRIKIEKKGPVADRLALWALLSLCAPLRWYLADLRPAPGGALEEGSRTAGRNRVPTAERDTVETVPSTSPEIFLSTRWAPILKNVLETVRRSASLWICWEWWLNSTMPYHLPWAVSFLFYYNRLGNVFNTDLRFIEDRYWWWSKRMCRRREEQ